MTVHKKIFEMLKMTNVEKLFEMWEELVRSPSSF